MLEKFIRRSPKTQSSLRAKEPYRVLFWLTSERGAEGNQLCMNGKIESRSLFAVEKLGTASSAASTTAAATTSWNEKCYTLDIQFFVTAFL